MSWLLLRVIKLTSDIVACRLPGGVRSPADLWQFLLKKKSAQGVVPPVRYNIKGYYSQEGDKAGVMNVEGGYFLQEDVRQFDNEFFGINNFEATYGKHYNYEYFIS